MLKKSYTGLIIWMIVYIGCLPLLSLLPIEDEDIMIRLIFLITVVALIGLMLMIYVSEKVYWINGVTYEEAVEAGSERRKLFALRHIIPFGILTAAYVLFSIIMSILHWPFWIDIIVFTGGTIAAAVSTIRIKL